MQLNISIKVVILCPVCIFLLLGTTYLKNLVPSPPMALLRIPTGIVESGADGQGLQSVSTRNNLGTR